MTLTTAMIEERLANLKAGREQLLVKLAAQDGAIQDCQHWLDILNAEEAPGEPAAGDPPETNPAAT